MDSLRRPIATLSDSSNLCQAVKSDKGTGSDKRLRIVTAMLSQVFCGAQGATLAFVTTATMLADALTKAFGLLPFVACGDERASLHVPMPSELVPNLKMAIGSQLIRSAESQSGKSGPSTLSTLSRAPCLKSISLFSSMSDFNIITVDHMKKMRTFEMDVLRFVFF